MHHKAVERPHLSLLLIISSKSLAGTLLPTQFYTVAANDLLIAGHETQIVDIYGPLRKSATLSIDDFYLTAEGQVIL